MKYKNAIQQLMNVVVDIKNKDPSTTFSFIQIDYTELKANLTEFANDYIQMIFTNLTQESKKELKEFVDELKQTVDDLKVPCTTLEQLKRNMHKQ